MTKTFTFYEMKSVSSNINYWYMILRKWKTPRKSYYPRKREVVPQAFSASMARSWKRTMRKFWIYFCQVPQIRLVHGQNVQLDIEKKRGKTILRIILVKSVCFGKSGNRKTQIRKRLGRLFRPNVKQREMGLWMLDKDTIRKC